MPSYRDQPAFALDQLVNEMCEQVDSVRESDSENPSPIARCVLSEGDFELLRTLRTKETDPLRVTLTDPAGGKAVYLHQISPGVRKIWKLTTRAALQLTLGDVQDFADEQKLDFLTAWRIILICRAYQCLAAKVKIELFFRKELRSKLQTALNDFFEEAEIFSFNTLGFVLRDPEYLERSSQYLKERKVRTNAVRRKGRKKGITLPPDIEAFETDYQKICSEIASLKRSRVTNRITHKRITKKEVADRVFYLNSHPVRKLNAVLGFFSVSFEDLVALPNHTK